MSLNRFKNEGRMFLEKGDIHTQISDPRCKLCIQGVHQLCHRTKYDSKIFET